jgi:hypothetical protein
MTLTDEQRAKVDEIVATRVMGWRRRLKTDVYNLTRDPDNDDDSWLDGFTNQWYNDKDDAVAHVEDEGGCVEDYEYGWSPTTSGDAMLEVIKKMRANDWDFRHEACAGRVELAEFAKWDEVYKDEYMKFCADAPTMPLAVCLASLSAVGVDWRKELGIIEGVKA